MTKIWKKILIFIIGIGMVVLPFSVYAEEPTTGTGTEETEESKDPTPSTDDPETEKPTEPTPTPTPEITIKPRLQSLSVEGFNLNEAFDPEKANYTLTVPASTTKIIVQAVAAEGCTVFQGNGTKDLEEGKTTVINVIAKVQGKSEMQTYTLSVTRPAESVNLKSLMVSGYSLNETFSQNNYTYTMTVPYDVTKLDISAVAENSTDSVEISGADSLMVGENRVTVTVRSESGKEVKYEILVTREEESEETNHSSNITSQMVVEEKSENSLVKYILITIGCVVLIAIAAVGIIFYMKSASPEKKAAKEARKKAKKDSKEQKQETEVQKVIPTTTVQEEKVEEHPEIDVLEDSEDTKEAPTIKSAKDDILEGMDDILDDKD